MQMERRIGASLGCLAFSVSVVGGLIVGNPIDTIVRRSLVALFGFFVLGVSVGWISGRVIAERNEQLEEELEARIAAGATESAERRDADRGTDPSRGIGDEPSAATRPAAEA